MAYMSQELKNELAPKIKEILHRYGLKWTLSVRNDMELILKIKSWNIDFRWLMKDKYRYYNENDNSLVDKYKFYHIDVNEYYLDRTYESPAKEALMELYAAMMDWNHNNSDIQTDYFDVGWYVDIKIGDWDKEYILL